MAVAINKYISRANQRDQQNDRPIDDCSGQWLRAEKALLPLLRISSRTGKGAESIEATIYLFACPLLISCHLQLEWFLSGSANNQPANNQPTTTMRGRGNLCIWFCLLIWPVEDVYVHVYVCMSMWEEEEERNQINGFLSPARFWVPSRCFLGCFLVCLGPLASELVVSCKFAHTHTYLCVCSSCFWENSFCVQFINRQNSGERERE